MGEDSGNIQKVQECLGSMWKLIEVHGSIWKGTEHSGSFWKQLEISRNTSPNVACNASQVTVTL
jgi:hypothetical protein